MTHCKEAPTFKGLVIATNQLGEAMLQFHVATDFHDQMRSATQAQKTLATCMLIIFQITSV